MINFITKKVKYNTNYEYYYWRGKERSEKIKNKLIILFLIIILSIKPVNAKETDTFEDLKDITNNVEIRYRWYKEKITGDYYPLKDFQEGYIVDMNKVKPGYISDWSGYECSLPKNYYFIEYDFQMIYESVKSIRFVEIKGITYDNNIKIYYENELIDYRIVKDEENLIVLNLRKEYRADTLIFYIDTDKEYQITLYVEQYLNEPMLSKTISSKIPFTPDESWKTSTTRYSNHYTTDEYKETTLTKRKSKDQICRSTEILAYKYKVEREYYDENYYTYVEGYIKDELDYKLFYKEAPVVNTIEITKEITKEKIVKQPQIQYIYLPSENEIIKIDSSKDNIDKSECTPQIKTEIITEYETIEKYLYKIPKKVYIIITILILLIILLIIKLYKKYVDETF